MQDAASANEGSVSYPQVRYHCRFPARITVVIMHDDIRFVRAINSLHNFRCYAASLSIGVQQLTYMHHGTEAAHDV
jgi:hypothetical protein